MDKYKRLGGPDDEICNKAHDDDWQKGVNRIVEKIMHNAEQASSEWREPQVGDSIIFVDPNAVDHNALVICVWQNKMINCVMVEADESRTDSYGRQIARPTSVPHMSNSPVHGLHWRWAKEEKAPIAQPVQN